MPATPSNESTTPGITYEQLADEIAAAGPGTAITMPQLLALWAEVGALRARVKALEVRP